MGKTYTGDLIRKHRKEKGLTQKQLGELCGINEANIRKYELGNQNPKIGTLRRIADALGVGLYELANWAQYTPEEIDEDLAAAPVGTVITLVANTGHANRQEVIATLKKGAKDKIDALNYLGTSRAFDYINYLTEKPENTEPDKT